MYDHYTTAERELAERSRPSNAGAGANLTLFAGDLLQGRYRVAGPVGFGGMGSVFLAAEEPHGKTRVVKQLRLDAPELLDAFRGEFALLSTLTHPHLLRVLDFGSEQLRGDVVHYYVADHVDGSSLLQHANAATSSIALLRPILDALEGLAVLHGAGIRHGDFTPSNILVDKLGNGTLIDLGCAQPFGPVNAVSGTEGYIAPEVLAGAASDARADLYSAGKTLLRVFALSTLEPSPEIKKLIERLVRADPRSRPTDVTEVLEAFRRRPATGGRQVLPHRLLGRASELERFEAWLQKFCLDKSAPPVVSVSGAPGSGVSRLVKELVWRAELRVGVRRARTHEPGCVGRLLAQVLGASLPIHSLRGLLSAVSTLEESAQPLLLVFEDSDRLEPEDLELLLSLLRSLKQGTALAVLISGRTAPTDVAVCELTSAALTAAEVRTWAGGTTSERQLESLVASSGGLPRKIEASLREMAGAAATPEAPIAGDLSRINAAIAGLDRASRSLLARLFASLQAGDSELDQADEQGLLALLESRLLQREGERFTLPADAQRALAVGALEPGELTGAHRELAERLLRREQSATPTVLMQLLWHLFEGDEAERAQGLFLEHSAQLGLAPRSAILRLQPLLARSRDARVLLGAATLLASTKQPRLALSFAVRAAHFDPGMALDASLLVVDALLKLGKPQRAERLLAGTSTHHPPDGRLSLRVARARLASGAYLQAREAAERALSESLGSPIEASVHEILGIVCSYLGELERAQTELGISLSLLGDTAAGRDRFRIRSHSALVAFRRGQVDTALSEYSSALALAEAHDLDDVLAIALLNLGTAEQQTGAWGSALRRYERGLSFARAGARTDTELTLEYNLANLYADIGAFERAEESLSRLATRVQAQRIGHLAPAMLLLRAELSLLREQPNEAEALLEVAERDLVASGQARELLEVRLRLIDADLALGHLSRAKLRLEAVRSGDHENDAHDLTLNLELCSARVGAAAGETSALAALESLKAQAQRANLLAFEATVASDLAATSELLVSAESAMPHAEHARRLWDRIAVDLPSALGELFWRHPRRIKLAELSKSFPRPSPGDSTALRRILALNRRLNSPHPLERVLEYALQASVDLTLAERGYLVLCAPSENVDDAPKLTVAVTSDADSAAQAPSQSILRRVTDRQEAVLTTDAGADPRFSGQRSVHAMQLKSVLCVPIVSASGALGAIYLNSRIQHRRFTDADRDLLLAFADQVAVAITNKRLLEEVERQREALERKTSELEQTARSQSREVERLRLEVLTQKQTLELRYDYSQILGRGPAMRRLLERLDRVTDASVSVLILGESGTGKELVARALHWNGPRRSGPFLGINCAALPESLLESELFGHTRGAFTGADRDKLGLLQAAAGGTLFLDEIGELPLAIQAKLLRVLQEREVRPLGSSTAVPLDIRLLAATHRDLTRDVSEGRFREDLYYRIAVLTLQVPPLRERLEDIPALAAKILAELARSAERPPITLAQDALRKLATHPFRGNVRELQNILTRAFVLSTGAALRAEDIDFGASPVAVRGSDSRQDFQKQERERILEALRGARWNVTAVAQALGMPRVTLHRKLKRYGITRDSQR